MQPAPRDSSGLLRRNLENDPSVIYALDSELRIEYCNEAWDRFAAENGGQGVERRHQLGRAVLDVVPPPLKVFYAEGYRKALVSRQRWEHSYECSSPALYRHFHLAAYPDPQGSGIIVINSLMVEESHVRTAAANGTLEYVDNNGLITMCCNCRRTRRVRPATAWDWVPAFLETTPALVSHGICPVCINLHYPELSGVSS